MIAKWRQGVNAGSRHWVSVPGVVKGINAGNADRAALIVAAVNNHDSLLAALRGLVAQVEPGTCQAMDVAIAAISEATKDTQ